MTAYFHLVTTAKPSKQHPYNNEPSDTDLLNSAKNPRLELDQKLSTTLAASAVVLVARGGLFCECATLVALVFFFFLFNNRCWTPRYRRQAGCNKSIRLDGFSDNGHLANVCGHSLFASSDLFFFLLHVPFFRHSPAYIIHWLFAAGQVM